MEEKRKLVSALQSLRPPPPYRITTERFSVGLGVLFNCTALATTEDKSERMKSWWTGPIQGDLINSEMQPAVRAASASCHLSLITNE